jgi:small subunit ribosomal protein S8
MSMTDPIADLLTRIRNAHLAKHPSVDIPASKMKLGIIKIMKDEGYIDDFETVEDARQGMIRVGLKYLRSGEAAIRGMERVSRPGRRVYRGKGEIPKVLNGLGVVVVSTPEGVLSGSACHRRGVGGEVLCNIW